MAEMVALTLVALFANGRSLPAQQRRAMTVDDVLALQELGQVEPSPDGRWLAVVVTRPNSANERYQDLDYGRDRGDVWLISRRDGRARNLTQGLKDQTSHTNPVWSPDSRRLAFASTRGGVDGLYPYLWDVANGQLRRLGDEPMDMRALDGNRPSPALALVWLDSTTLVYAAPAPEREAADAAPGASRLPRTAGRQWGLAEAGQIATASVLESGRDVPMAERPAGALLAINALTGDTRALLRANVRRLMLSPTRRHLAVFTESGRVPPHASSTMPSTVERWFAFYRSRLAMITAGSPITSRWIDDVPDPMLWDYDNPHSWAPDGSALAVVGKARPGDESMPRTLWTISAAAGRARRADWRGELEVARSVWSEDGKVLCLASVRHRAPEDSSSRRRDWWLVAATDSAMPINLTVGMTAVPAMLVRTSIRPSMVGVASGKLWEIDIGSHLVQNRAADISSTLTDIAWPLMGETTLQPAAELLVRDARGDLYRFDASSPSARPNKLPLPAQGAALVAYGSTDHTAVFRLDGRDGTFLWAGNAITGGFTKVITLNEQLQALADPERVLIDYLGVEGDSLRALLLLPIGHAAGQRVPTIVDVYYGRVVTDTTPYRPLYEKWFASAENLYPLLSRGYAVLLPSMPRQLGDGPRFDPFIDLPKGVMAAVDRAISLGYADPDRLGVMGHSYGGYSTYAMVAYTGRFKAAVARAGFANGTSAYGTFSGRGRYDDFVHEDLFEQQYLEAGGVGTPAADETPWGNLWGFVRNSPYYWVDRVRTPLMIVHGDRDFVPMQEGEQFFSALYRQGKKAQFVRYWGEGHVLVSPANIRDQWQRIFRWFDDNLAVGHSPKVPSGIDGR